MGSVLTPTLFFVLILPFVAANDNDTHLCGGDGWAPFSETQCIKLFFQVGDQTHKFAKKFCAFERGTRLITVQSEAEQKALQDYFSRQHKSDLATLANLWLDGSDEQYNPHLPYDSSVFRWGCNEENQRNLSSLTFTNWAQGQPVKPPSKNTTCIQMYATLDSFGKWSNEPCSNRNAVVCMRKQRWSGEKMQEVLKEVVESQKNFVPLDLLEKMQKVIEKMEETIKELQKNGKQNKNTNENMQIEIKKMQGNVKQNKDTNENMQIEIKKMQGNVKQNKDTNTNMQKEIEKLTRNTVPIGFIYIQLPNQKSPLVIWPHYRWNDDSDQYDSAFFRVDGSKSANFGYVQEEFSPYIDEIKYSECYGRECDFKNNTMWSIGLQNQGWSPNVMSASLERGTGEWYKGLLQFHTAGGEVRPKNIAIRVWRRFA